MPVCVISASTSESAPEHKRVNFIELAATPGTPLNCLDIVGVNGSNCDFLDPISLEGHTMPDDGLFLIVEAINPWEWTQDDDCPAGRNWYYAHVQFAVSDPALRDLDWGLPEPLPWNLKPAYGIDAWTSPVWITRRL